ncbi:2-amino-4-hydroxy-6-hydroxymethyldihydropteridine diphosphokinase [Kutzneria kofuensis]|uniref:2-amino-4-hydroxy-6-hydroxymethyldihydropteridine diphosphokinase n=1 Tax=Kutzneria kofuensis TaxID=103725 RepID=A0A7W9KI54_9PSEU|nr:2-amino-4-hydroxy-6-hydroxymethyldihydropteridine diphosphokinase [Kutzneria kofuensis]MBB5892294.1 2-amino-4-hydroxy-6-hydroxymethyldihydropteridine diphosphokinase [Kutzneria kofuensis]
MTRAVLSLGSNLGDRLAFLQGAVTGLRPHLEAVSPVYETAAWGVEEQPDFLNAIVIVQAGDVDEWGWLRLGQRLENEAGRVREQRWGPRTLDVDVVTVDGVSSTHPDLLLPHPGTPERATVLIPWLDVEPDAVLPGHGRIADVMAGLSADGVRRRDDLRLEW